MCEIKDNQVDQSTCRLSIFLAVSALMANVPHASCPADTDSKILSEIKTAYFEKKEKDCSTVGGYHDTSILHSSTS